MGRKSIPDMTYEELEKEHQKNTFAKQRLANQSEKETNSKVQLELTRQILSLARRNERLVKQQLTLMKNQLYELSQSKLEPKLEAKPETKLEAKPNTTKKGNLKKPLEMSLDELEAEIEANNTRCEELEKPIKSSDIDTRIEADKEIRTLANSQSDNETGSAKDCVTESSNISTKARKILRPKPKPKPILKSERISKKIKKQNHYRPGFVYIFHNPLAVLARNITMCKVGLSGKPEQRRYYLSEEYQSNLIIKAIAPTMNMRVTEILMHKTFAKHNVLRERGLDGYGMVRCQLPENYSDAGIAVFGSYCCQFSLSGGCGSDDFDDRSNSFLGN